MVIWHNEKDVLKRKTRQFRQYINDRLSLQLKEPVINNTESGLPFLGYVLFPFHISLSCNGKKRFNRKTALYYHKLETKEWNENEFQGHIRPLLAFTLHADTCNFRKKILYRKETCL